ncbi:FAD-binding oxidoreductase [Pseudorhodoferax sp.]|uniref:FAD-binding oxidoreductase n=1 Tax=Pseudorhodoferax sp. TaxID=1993553 RepID=UPI0039E4C2F5
MDNPLDLGSLRAAFSGRLLDNTDDMAPFLTDYRGRFTGRALAVVLPDSATDVAAVVRWCATHRMAVVPQGGNTGLVGGGVPNETGQSVLLSLQRMQRVLEIDPLNNTLTVQAGCILANVQEAARKANRLFPLSLGAEGSCTIGGNLATNAGGIQVLRYGNARDLCLGLEVVTADGHIWNGLRSLRKDNTGYDLKQFFIGSEGTLGIITAATLKLYPQPAAQMTAFAAVPTAFAALKLFELAQRRLAATLTAFELLDAECVDVIERNSPCRKPLQVDSPFYVLLESSDPTSAERATENFQALMEEAMETGIVSDAAVATSLSQSDSFWALRHHVAEAQAREGENLKHDISLPISRIPQFIEEARAAITAKDPSLRIISFGHMGDGNLHYNISPRRGADAAEYASFRAGEKKLSALVYEVVSCLNGSISAEHGIGALKMSDNARYKTALELRLMADIKRALDPQGVFNPGRLFPVEQPANNATRS